MLAKKPFLRVTKWLGMIPVEAQCTLCADAKFRAAGSGHRPELTQYQASLQSQFDEHVKLAHLSADAARESASSKEPE